MEIGAVAVAGLGGAALQGWVASDQGCAGKRAGVKAGLRLELGAVVGLLQV